MDFAGKLKRLIKRILGARFAVRRRLRHELAYGEPEIALIPLLCRPGMEFLDVGANLGVYSFYAKHYCQHVYALEPHPALINDLRTILGERGTVLAVAASDQTGTARLSIPLDNGSDVESRSSLRSNANPGFDIRETDVRTARIDDLGFKRIGVVKIDVEGHEFAVLKGAQNLLETQHPITIVECEERHNLGGVERVFKFFERLAYRPYYLHRGKLYQGDTFDVARLQAPGNAKSVKGGRSPDYINNFIFIHVDDVSVVAEIKKRYG